MFQLKREKPIATVSFVSPIAARSNIRSSDQTNRCIDIKALLHTVRDCTMRLLFNIDNKTFSRYLRPTIIAQNLIGRLACDRHWSRSPNRVRWAGLTDDNAQNRLKRWPKRSTNFCCKPSSVAGYHGSAISAVTIRYQKLWNSRR